MLRIVASLCLIFLAVAAAPAQIVRGTVTDRETSGPLQGVFVMLLDSAAGMRAAVLTDQNGFFAMQAPMPGSFTLRAERIGHQSIASAPFVLTEDAARTVDLRVAVQAIDLAPITASGTTRCVARPKTGERTARLWDEARKALTVARWVERQTAIQFESRKYVRELEPHSLHVRSEAVRYSVSHGLPYAALNADTLARYGFAQKDATGLVFFGPDAEVLLSDAFLDGHCFHNVNGTRENHGMTGLAFRPTALSKLPDVTGTLWLDARTLELRHIDYAYTNLGREYRVRAMGGRTEFRRLDNGVWFVSKWHIRVPTLVQSSMERGEYRLAAMQEEGGEVLRVRDRAATETIAHAGTVAGAVHDSVRGEPLANALVYLSGTTHRATTDEMGRFRITDVPEGRYLIAFAHGALDSVPALPDPRAVTVQSLQTAEVDLAIGAVRSQLAAKCPTVYGQGGPSDGAAGVLFGNVKNEIGHVIADATVTVFGMTRQTPSATVRSDRSGAYLVCGLPVDEPLRVEVSYVGIVASSKLELPSTAYRRVDLYVRKW